MAFVFDATLQTLSHAVYILLCSPLMQITVWINVKPGTSKQVENNSTSFERLAST